MTRARKKLGEFNDDQRPKAIDAGDMVNGYPRWDSMGFNGDIMAIEDEISNWDTEVASSFCFFFLQVAMT